MNRPLASIKLDAGLLADARKAAATEGVDLEAFVGGVVERAVSDVLGRDHWRGRAAKADIAKAREILRRPGGRPPAPGDEIPQR